MEYGLQYGPMWTTNSEIILEYHVSTDIFVHCGLGGIVF